MQFVRSQFRRFMRFLRGESIQSSRDQAVWAAKLFGLTLVLGLVLSPLVFLATGTGASANSGAGPASSQASSSSPTATPTPKPAPNAPVKGLSDDATYRWWSWPNAPQPDSWWAQVNNPQFIQTQLDMMHDLGVKLFRPELPWPFVAPSMPGGSTYNSALARDPNWSGYHWQTWDAIVKYASDGGIQLEPIIAYTPQWANGITVDNGGPESPPSAAQYFGDFVYAAALRYKGQIHYWEMWNEEDYPPHAWSGTMQQYVDLILKPGYQAVKQVDPTAKVLLGGLAGDSIIGKIYDDGGGPYFDIANFHAYYSVEGDLTSLQHVLSAMHKHGDNKPVWLTEFGMATQPDGARGNPGTIVTPNQEADQAKLISQVYSRLNIQVIMLYQLHDTGLFDANDSIVYVTYAGIVSRDYSHRKPGYQAYKDAVGGSLPTFTTGKVVVSGNTLSPIRWLGGSQEAFFSEDVRWRRSMGRA